jgi:hypothetical protein
MPIRKVRTPPDIVAQIELVDNLIIDSHRAIPRRITVEERELLKRISNTLHAVAGDPEEAEEADTEPTTREKRESVTEWAQTRVTDKANLLGILATLVAGVDEGEDVIAYIDTVVRHVVETADQEGGAS